MTIDDEKTIRRIVSEELDKRFIPAPSPIVELRPLKIMEEFGPLQDPKNQVHTAEPEY